MSNVTITTPSDLEIQITRVFNAPRSLVFEAMSKPEFIKRWMLGPPGWSMIQCDDDLRVGGKFRCAWRNEEGEELAMSGVYREVVSPERIVRTETFEVGCDSQAGEQLATLVLTDQGDKTLLTISLLYPSREARDATIASGMEHGVEAGYNRLDELLAVERGKKATGSV
jgi:uncharacterized protein YndB with AHSA1/START domain